MGTTSKLGTIARLGNGNGTVTNTDARDLKHGAGRDSARTYRQCLVESGEIIQFMPAWDMDETSWRTGTKADLEGGRVSE